MRPLPRIAALLLSICAAGGASAQVSQQGDVVVLPSTSSVYNQTGIYMPSIPTPNGQDEVRAADGFTCRSAVAHNGPYVDFGTVGSSDVHDRHSDAVYGRVVIPIGKKPKRLDCSKLYELEITRLRMELKLLQMGLSGGDGGGIPASGAQTAVR